MTFVLPAADKWNNDRHFYDMQLLAYAGAIFDPTRAVVDVGANVGYVASFLALRCRSVLLAYEPSLECFEALLANTSQIQNIEHRRKAVGDRCGPATLLDSSSVTSHIVDRPSRSGKLREVDMVTLDSECAGYDVGLIKIDVEGYEVKILEGALQTIKRCRPIVVVETMDQWLKRTGHSVRSIVTYFERLDYQPPVNKFGQRTTSASDLIFAPKGVFLPKSYLSFLKSAQAEPAEEDLEPAEDPGPDLFSTLSS